MTVKPCEQSRGHIFNPNFMKLNQNYCLDDVSVKFESGSCGVKRQKKPCEHACGHIFNPNFMKLSQSDCLDDVSAMFASGPYGVKK